MYALEPNGLVFAAPAQIRLTLPVPPDRSLPLLLSVSGGKTEWLAGLEYTLDADAGTLLVTAPVAHFSSVALVLGFFTATLQDPPSQPLNKPFDDPLVVARVRTLITTTTEGGDVINSTSTAPWTLTGELKAARTLAPRTVSGAPKAQNITVNQFTLSPIFTCTTAGNATITYNATLNAETTTGGFDAAADYPINITTRTFQCLGAGTSQPPAGSIGPPVLTRFTADFQSAKFSTFYEVKATDPENKGLRYYWSLSETCDSFNWDTTGGSPKATWVHRHPPCPPVKDHHPGEITVRVVAASGLESVFIYRSGSASADIDLTKPTPTPTPTATPTPKP